ncbi:MAG: hypothetical protein ACR2QG_03105 [Gammaproteobacteria bacterium]
MNGVCSGHMLIKHLKFIALSLLAGLPSVVQADEQNWQRLTGEATLTEFMSDARLEADFGGRMKSVATYNADGSGFIETWNGRFERRWSIENDELVCIESRTERNCFHIEQDKQDPDRFRVVNEQNQTAMINRLSANDPIIFVPGDDDYDERTGLPSLNEIANEIINPNTSLALLDFDNDYVRFDGDLDGADTKSRLVTTLRPIAPFTVGDPQDRTNFYLRPVLPIIWRSDFPTEDGEYKSEGIDLGDLSLNPSIRKSYNNGLILGYGAGLTLPTATDDTLGFDQVLLGPSVAIGLNKRWGLLAVVAQTVWDVAGEDDYDTHLTTIRPLYSFRLNKGWQIYGNPTIIYDHEADSDNDLALPVSLGLAKTSVINGRPIRFGLEYWHFIESPDQYGPDYQIRFTITPTMTAPWLKRVCDDRLPWC